MRPRGDELFILGVAAAALAALLVLAYTGLLDPAA